MPIKYVLHNVRNNNDHEHAISIFNRKKLRKTVLK